jgi:hypothetical protein
LRLDLRLILSPLRLDTPLVPLALDLLHVLFNLSLDPVGLALRLDSLRGSLTLSLTFAVAAAGLTLPRELFFLLRASLVRPSASARPSYVAVSRALRRACALISRWTRL